MGEGTFQVSACAIIERPDGRILMMRRTSDIVSGGEWEFPGGRLQQFESFESGLRREVQEETSLTNIIIVMSVAAFTYMRGGAAASNEVKGVTFWCSDPGEAEVMPSDEHDTVEWMEIDDAIERANRETIKIDLCAFRDIRKRMEK